MKNMIINSKYEGYGAVEFDDDRESNNPLAAGYLRNNTDKILLFSYNDLEDWYGKPLEIKSHDSIGIMYDLVDYVLNGDFKARYE